MKKRYYIISGIIAYLFFLIITIPAAPVLALLQSRVPAISIQGASGSLWQGRVATITIDRQHVLNDTDWQFNFLSLFSGEFGAHINSHYSQQALTGDIGISLLGTVTARDVKANMDAAALAQLAQIPVGEFAGKVALQIERLEWQQQQVPRAMASLQWQGAAVTVAETADLGDILIIFTESETRPLHASISNTNGQIKLEGEANVGEDGAYTLQLNMLPDQNASDNIRSSLGMVARPKPDGSYQLDNTGNLKQFGLI